MDVLNPMDGKLSHVKSDSFVRETITHSTVIHMAGGEGPTKFAVIFSKEAIDLGTETLLRQGETQNFTASITESDVKLFRLQIANFTIDETVAVKLHEALGAALVGAGVLDAEK